MIDTNSSYTLAIQAGTKVLGKNGIVTLKDDCIVTGAQRQDSGEFLYSLGSNQYYVSAGCCSFSPESDAAWMHKDGLVAFA
jgi:hypothetical protein